MKQTAVKWLVKELLKRSDIEYINGYNNLVEQAKAMEKEQQIEKLEALLKELKGVDMFDVWSKLF